MEIKSDSKRACTVVLGSQKLSLQHQAGYRSALHDVLVIRRGVLLVVGRCPQLGGVLQPWGGGLQPGSSLQRGGPGGVYSVGLGVYSVGPGVYSVGAFHSGGGSTAWGRRQPGRGYSLECPAALRGVYSLEVLSAASTDILPLADTPLYQSLPGYEVFQPSQG